MKSTRNCLEKTKNRHFGVLVTYSDGPIKMHISTSAARTKQSQHSQLGWNSWNRLELVSLSLHLGRGQIIFKYTKRVRSFLHICMMTLLFIHLHLRLKENTSQLPFKTDCLIFFLQVILEEKDLEIIGTPIVKYDDKEVIVQHIESGLWLSYKTYQVKKPGVGLVEEKQVILHEEGRMDDSVAFSRSQEDEARTARVIRKCSALFNQFSRGLDAMQDSQRHSGFFRMIDLGEMVGCLEDLVTYFAQPEEDLSNEDRQKFMRALTNR